MAHAQQRAHGEQVEHDPAGAVHEVEDLQFGPAPGIEHGLQPGKFRRKALHDRVQGFRTGTGPVALPDLGHDGHGEQALELQQIQDMAQLGDGAAAGQIGRAGVEHAAKGLALDKGEGPAVGGPAAFPVGVVQAGLGEENGVEALAQARGNERGLDQSLAVFELAQGANLASGVVVMDESVDEPVDAGQASVVFGHHLGIGLLGEQMPEHGVGAGHVDLVRGQGHHEAQLLGGGVFLRINGVFEVVLGHEMQKPGVEDGIDAIARGLAGDGQDGGHFLNHGRLMNPLSRRRSK